MKNLTIVSGLGVAFILGGCATSSPIMTESGKLGHAIDCSSVSMAQCYELAGEKCAQKGYKVLNKKNQSQGFFTPANKNLIIECK